MNKKSIVLALFTGMAVLLPAQQIDVENISKIASAKPVTLNGGLSAGNVFYSGNGQSGRQSWTYYLNGSVNINLYGQINLPFSVNLTNVGKDMSYPSLPNRLSVHPTYKWITAHIGDVSMSFSSYTLSGHQFSGAGVDLTPGNRWKISAMTGRLLKKVESDAGNPSVMPNYKRSGAGVKVQYDHSKYSAGMIWFAASDREDRSMYRAMDSLGISPLSNQAFGWNGTLNLIKNVTLNMEYALSFMTWDSRAPSKGNSFVYKMLGAKTSTEAYHAVNARLNYRFWKNTIGIGYERIDPEYKTLGAYYFNNDYENLTLNYARPFLKGDKAGIAASFGVQRDDLDGNKEESSNRYVASVNLNYSPSEALQASVSYSTFQSYRNLKSQFDYINEISPYDNMDTLRFTQLSQNIDGSLTYTFKGTEKQQRRLNLNVSFQESADRQGGVSLPGNVSRFLNSAMGYGVQFIPQSINLTSSVNVSYNYGGTVESYTLGPTLGATASFFQKMLTTGFSTAYNVNISEGDITARVFNLRANASYRVRKKHNLNANVVWQNRNITGRKKTDGTTVTVAYSYSF